MSDILTFRNVWVRYGEKVVLEKVNLAVAEGAFVSIVGPSGAGKSTFLRLVLGQERPSVGVIRLDGQPLRPEPGKDRGVVFQRYSVFPHLSVIDNVMFGLDCQGSSFFGRLRGEKRRAALAAAGAMLESVGLGAAMDVHPAQLSGGMQQRLAIAQALITRPRILLLDEPFGALDPGVRLDMHELITGLWRKHKLTILMVTHDIKEAFRLGTRVIAFDKIRRDPQAPNANGSTTTFDLALDAKTPPPDPRAARRHGRGGRAYPSGDAWRGLQLGGMIRFMSHMAPSELRAIGMAVTTIAGLAGAFVAIFAGLWTARRARARDFAIQSARRIRARGIGPRSQAHRGAAAGWQK